MKKVLLLFIITGICSGLSAQTFKYTPNPGLDKFIGTWVYSENGKKVNIVLKKVKVDSEGTSIDMIEGYHTFSVADNPVDVANEQGTPSLTRGGFFSMNYNLDLDGQNQIAITVSDPKRKKTGEAILTFLGGTPNQMRWNLRQGREGIIVHKPGEPKCDREFTFPKSMTLTKQN